MCRGPGPISRAMNQRALHTWIHPACETRSHHPDSFVEGAVSRPTAERGKCLSSCHWPAILLALLQDKGHHRRIQTLRSTYPVIYWQLGCELDYVLHEVCVVIDRVAINASKCDIGKSLNVLGVDGPQGLQYMTFLLRGSASRDNIGAC